MITTRIEHSHNTIHTSIVNTYILIGYIVFRSFAVQVAFVLAFQLAEHYMQQQSDENSYHTRKKRNHNLFNEAQTRLPDQLVARPIKRLEICARKMNQQ